jgi:cytidine deaminase
MKKSAYSFSFEEYDSIDELAKEDADLLKKAREVTRDAYAPYSQFYVGAAARMKNGAIITGTNQENASYPAGICAERVLLSVAGSLYPNMPIESIAITHRPETGASDHPVAPCGICRQSLKEFETRVKQPVRLILAGMEGKIHIIAQASALLPFAFSGEELK